jgi:hypothetical protein
VCDNKPQIVREPEKFEILIELSSPLTPTECASRLRELSGDSAAVSRNETRILTDFLIAELDAHPEEPVAEAPIQSS